MPNMDGQLSEGKEKQNPLKSHLKLFLFVRPLAKPIEKSVIYESYKVLVRSQSPL